MTNFPQDRDQDHNDTGPDLSPEVKKLIDDLLDGLLGGTDGSNAPHGDHTALNTPLSIPPAGDPLLIAQIVDTDLANPQPQNVLEGLYNSKSLLQKKFFLLHLNINKVLQSVGYRHGLNIITGVAVDAKKRYGTASPEFRFLEFMTLLLLNTNPNTRQYAGLPRDSTTIIKVVDGVLTVTSVDVPEKARRDAKSSN